mmetsp:Transcript_36097/g.103802  ORF Transcript_36097/g.103802 Transcript_36097/m.103802 type:complete len:259 (+) Transcript_36097:1464-2240(+)
METRCGPARMPCCGTWHTPTPRNSTAHISTSTLVSGASTLTSSHRARKARTATARSPARATTRRTRQAARSRAGRRSASTAGYTTPTHWSAATTQAEQFDLCLMHRAYLQRRRPRSPWRAAPTRAGASCRRPTGPASGRPWARDWPSRSWTCTAGAGTRGCWPGGRPSPSWRRAGILRAPATCLRSSGLYCRHGTPGSPHGLGVTALCRSLACGGASSRWCTRRMCTSAGNQRRQARRLPRRSLVTRWPSSSSAVTAG